MMFKNAIRYFQLITSSKIGFRRKRDAVTIIRRTLSGIDVQRDAVRDIDNIELVDKGMPELDPGKTTQRIRNWLPLD